MPIDDKEINKVTIEYWKGKIVDQILSPPTSPLHKALLKAMYKATPEKPYKPNEGWVTTRGLSK